ncbi:MAG TPA: peptidylprolyl isomerase [Nitrospira sp.]|jgi:FKBP-type peptidyl-prolyl cis-trans isomerase SlyD|nr:peptidylprolyl isomerase [Nitrospira sp.]
MRNGRRLSLSLLIVLSWGHAWGDQVFAQDEMAIADGMKVSLQYTLTLPDKTVADSNVGQAPITFLQGAHEIVPGLEKALDGMKAGQKRRVEVAAQDAYGPYNNKLRQSVDKNKLPKDVKVGDILQAADNRLVKVLEVNEKKVLIDLNHPLAGKTLTFDVTILTVEKGEEPDSSETTRP